MEDQPKAKTGDHKVTYSTVLPLLLVVIYSIWFYFSVFSGNLVWSLKFADTSKAGSESRGCEEESIEEESK